MKTRLSILVLLLLASLALGCGSDRERGMNSPDKQKDLPRAAPTEKK